MKNGPPVLGCVSRRSNNKVIIRAPLPYVPATFTKPLVCGERSSAACNDYYPGALNDTSSELEFAMHVGRVSEHAQIFTSASPPFAITSTNNAWTALYGWRCDEVCGRACAMLQGKGICPMAKATIALGVMRKQRFCVLGVLTYKRSGASFIANLVFEPVSGERDGGAVTHYAVTSHLTADEAIRHAKAASTVAALGDKRSDCRNAAEHLARTGKCSLEDVLLAMVPLLSEFRGRALTCLIECLLEGMLWAVMQRVDQPKEVERDVGTESEARKLVNTRKLMNTRKLVDAKPKRKLRPPITGFDEIGVFHPPGGGYDSVPQSPASIKSPSSTSMSAMDVKPALSRALSHSTPTSALAKKHKVSEGPLPSKVASKLSVAEFYSLIREILGEETPMLGYFTDCLQHFGTACYCTP